MNWADREKPPRRTDYIQSHITNVFSEYKPGDNEQLKKAGLATHRDNLIGLLHEILDENDPERLNTIAQESFDHGVGYKKLILDENKEQGWRLRINMYWPRKDGMKMESWHTHRWPFVSTQVAGGGFDNWNYKVRPLTPDEDRVTQHVMALSEREGFDETKIKSIWRRIEACNLLEIGDKASMLASGGEDVLRRYANKEGLLNELEISEKDLPHLYAVRFKYEVPTRQETGGKMEPTLTGFVGMEFKNINHIMEGDQYVQPIEDAHRLIFYPTSPTYEKGSPIVQNVQYDTVNPSSITPTISAIVTAPAERKDTDYLFRSPIAQSESQERPSYSIDELKGVLKNFVKLLEVQKHREHYFVDIYNELLTNPTSRKYPESFRDMMPIMQELAEPLVGKGKRLNTDTPGLYDRFVLPAYVGGRKALGGAASDKFQEFKSKLTEYVEHNALAEKEAMLNGTYRYPELKSTGHIMTYGREGSGYTPSPT